MLILYSFIFKNIYISSLNNLYKVLIISGVDNLQTEHGFYIIHFNIIFAPLILINVALFINVNIIMLLLIESVYWYIVVKNIQL